MKRTLAQIEAVTSTPASVLVLGESGVGKEMVARADHEKSDLAEDIAPLAQHFLERSCAELGRVPMRAVATTQKTG